MRGNDTGYRYRDSVPFDAIPNSGSLGARSPYVPVEFGGRFASWCDAGDKICTGRTSFFHWDIGNHGEVYRDSVFSQSMNEVVGAAIAKRNELNPQSPPMPGAQTPPPPSGGYVNPPPPPSNNTIVASSDVDANGGADLVFTALRGDGFADVRVALSNKRWYENANNLRSLDGFGWAGITPLVGDVNGDDRSDVVFASNEHQNGTKIFVCLRTDLGLSMPILWWEGTGFPYEHLKFSIGDIDNNGADDVVLTALRADLFADVRVLLSGWDHFVDTGIWRDLTGFGWHGIKPLVGDVNGDKHADYIMLTNEHSAGVKAFALLSNGYGLTAPILWWDDTGYSWDLIKPALGDLDRNGKADILFAAKRADQFADLRVLLSNGSQFASVGNWRSLDGFGWDGLTPFAGDVNGDGAADAVIVTNEHQNGTDVYAFLSTTSGLNTVQHWWDGSGYGYEGIKVIVG